MNKKKTPKEVSSLFESIIKASVSGNPKPIEENLFKDLEKVLENGNEIEPNKKFYLKKGKKLTIYMWHCPSVLKGGPIKNMEDESLSKKIIFSLNDVLSEAIRMNKGGKFAGFVP